jgi:O-antigen/teichoic acid export membrane protein
VLLVSLALFALPFVACVATFAAAIRAFERHFAGQTLTLLAPRMITLCILVLLLTTPLMGEVDAVDAMGAYVGGSALATALAAIVLWRQPGYDWLRLSPRYRTRQWMKSVIPLSLIAGLQIVIFKTDIVMLRMLGDASSVALYHVAHQLGNLVFLAKAGVMMVTGPRLARLHRCGDHAAMQDQLRAAAGFLFLSGLPVALILLLYGRPLLTIIFGSQYAEAYGAMAVLAIGYLGLGLFGSVDTLLKMTNNEHAVLSTVAITAFLNIALNAIMIPLYGPSGAAFATASSILLWRILLAQRAYRLLDLVCFAFYRRV